MKGTITLLLLSFSILSIAQSNSKEIVNIDKRLFDVYEKDYLTTLQSANPNLLLRWSYYLDHAYYITDFPKEKENSNSPTLGLVKVKTGFPCFASLSMIGPAG